MRTVPIYPLGAWGADPGASSPEALKSLAIRLLTFLERSFFTLADGAKYSFSSRGKSQLQISTLRSRVELTDPNRSGREVKADTYGLVLAHSQSFRSVRVATSSFRSGLEFATSSSLTRTLLPQCEVV
ncbi:hypothetical protein TNCV_1618551 [Trichonephila clavipes]|nr:hypothetical protein TNCV_1618551 [Trichonephila clavipes]